MSEQQLFRNFDAMQICQISTLFSLDLFVLYACNGQCVNRVVLFVAKRRRPIDNLKMVQKLGVILA
jgi:hypothetical protein